MNMYAFPLIPWIELCAGILHVSLFVVFLVVFVALAPRHSAEFVFLKTQSWSGWNSDFASWNIGLLTPVWGFVGMLTNYNLGSTLSHTQTYNILQASMAQFT